MEHPRTIVVLSMLVTFSIIGSGSLAHYGSSGPDPIEDYARSAPLSGESIMIKMKAMSGDPVRDEMNVPGNLRQTEANGYYLVQLRGPPRPEWLGELRQHGARIQGYIPDYSYVMYMDDITAATVGGLSFVRWIGYYHPFYKVSRYLSERTGTLELNVMVFEGDGSENLARVAERVRTLGGVVTYDGRSNSIMRARIDASRIADVAFIPEVAWIDEYSEPVALMDNIRNFTGADMVHVKGYNGSGIVGEVKDNGFDEDHPEFEGQVAGVDGSPPVDAHGTATFGEVFSSGKKNWRAEGMLPGAQGVFAYWNVGRTASIDNLANNWGGQFQSNSWYSGTPNGSYSSFSKENDKAVFDHDVTMLYAAGNGGDPQTITQDASAKNVVSVGALLHFDNAWPTDDWFVSGNSGNQGPTEDWRIKPDLCGPYDAIFTTDVAGWPGYSSTDYTDSFGGTSGATPIVAGAAGLVYQMYKANHFGNNPDGDLPHAATVKAILIANAYQYNFTQADRFQQGWGLADVGGVYETGKYHFIIDQEVSLQLGASKTYYITSLGTQPLKISLVWTDPPALPAANPALVNNLNLMVAAPDGITEYWGNEGLVTGMWSSSGNDRDDLNNVENVFIQNPGLYKSWRIDVIAENIAEDGDPDTAEIDQHFALVVSGGFVDEDPPSTFHSVSGILGSNDWYISNVTVTLNSSDDMSGVAYTDYSLDGSPWTPYMGPFVVSDEGLHAIEYYSEDKVGNAENLKSFSIKIDATAPQHSSPNPVFNTTYDSYMNQIRLQLNWTDQVSGVSDVEFRFTFENGSWSDWLPYDGSSGDSYWFDVQRDIWIEQVGSRLDWESRAINDASLTNSTFPMEGTWILDDDQDAPFPASLSSEGSIDDSHASPYRITVDWEDWSGVSDVKFRYGNDSVLWSPWLNHTGSSGSVYWYDVPRIVWVGFLGSAIYWQSKVVDDDNDRGNDSLENSTSVQFGGNIVDDDTEPPSVIDMQSDGDVADSYGNPYRIQVVWDDYSGIAEASFRYGTDGVSWGPWLNSSGSSGSIFWYDIPRDEWIELVGSAIYWQAMSVDADGDRSNDSLENSTSVQFGGNIVDDDTEPPSVIDMQSDGDVLDSYGNPYRIQVDWDDYSGIAEASFRYGTEVVSLGPWLNSSGSSGTTYWYDIPRDIWIGLIGSAIYWQAMAVDADGDRPGDSLTNTTVIWFGGHINDDDDSQPLIVDVRAQYDSGTVSYSMWVNASDFSGWMLYVQYYYSQPSTIYSLGNFTVGSATAALFVEINGDELGNHDSERMYWRYRVEDFDDDRDHDSLGTQWSHWIQGIMLDLTPPTTMHYSYGDAGINDWFVSGVRVTLIPGDEGSGVDRTLYRVDGGDWIRYGDPFDIATSGVHVIEFYSVDEAENIEPVKSLVFKIDNTGPLANVGPDLEVSVGSTVILDGSGSTDDFGLLLYWWEIERDGELYAVLGGQLNSFTFNESGRYKITLTVTDLAGNTGKSAFWVNVLAPEPEPTEEQLSWWPLMILVPVAIVLALIIVLLMLKRRREDSDRTQENDLEKTG